MEIVEIVVLQKNLKSYVQEMILLNNLLQTGKNYNQMDSDTPQKDKRFFFCTKLNYNAKVTKFVLVI